MSTRSRVIAPLAAALMIGFSMTAPAQAVVASGEKGQPEQAPNAGGSAQAEQHRADPAQRSARDDNSSDARTDRDQRSTGTERSAEAKASGGNGSGSAGGSTSSNSAVQHERPNDYQAQSDPDGMDNEGVDQPGGDGGYPIDDQGTKDQDGNNGTGNDLDCEDDNRGKGVPGHCKDKADKAPDVVGGVEGEECPSGWVMGEDGECVKPADDEKDVTVVGTVTPPKAPGAQPEAQVLGVEKTATAPSAGFVEDFAQPQVKGVELAAPAALPQTGAAEYLTLLTIAGLGLATAGVLTLLFRRRLESGR